MAADKPTYEPSYRQQSVDDTLDSHDRRISRLEKGALIIGGYLIAEGANVVEQFSVLF